MRYNTGNHIADGLPYPEELDRKREPDWDSEQDKREEEQL